MSASLDNSAVSTGLRNVSFYSNLKEGQWKECSNFCTIVLTSYASKVMQKILQNSLQQYVNWELPDVQTGFRKSRETREQIANIHWIIKKKKKKKKGGGWTSKMHLVLLHWLWKVFDCMDHRNLWKILEEMGMPGHLTCLLRNLYAGQEILLELDMEQWIVSKFGKE